MSAGSKVLPALRRLSWRQHHSPLSCHQQLLSMGEDTDLLIHDFVPFGLTVLTLEYKDVQDYSVLKSSEGYM